MRKRELIWIGVLLLAGGIYARYFTTWFVHRQIAVHASFRPNRRGGGPDDTVIFFTLNDDFRLTTVKVIPWDDDKFNPKGRPVWNLISDSNSVPVRAFVYGQRIKGMKSALPNVKPDALTPGTAYRMVLTSGELSGYTDFQTRD